MQTRSQGDHISFCLTFRVSYWRLLYGGYSGDLSAELTFELLNKDENVVLVDIRPEARDCNFICLFLLIIFPLYGSLIM